MKVLWVPESPESRVPFFEGAAGLEYFSWSHGPGSQSLSRRVERTMYDNLGRGPYLLVRDGEIEEHIDVIQETKPSLADVEDYVQTVQWISALGIISEISVQNQGFTVDEHLSRTREETTYDDIV